MRRATAFLAALTLAAAALAGCGQSASDNKGADKAAKESNTASSGSEIKGTVTYMTAVPTYAKASNEIAAEVKKIYPDLDVKIEHVSDNYEAVLKAKMSSNSAPDIFKWSGFLGMKPMVEGNKVADLSDEGFEELIQPAYIESGKCDGKQYGIPTISQSVGLLYNKDVFKKAGITEPPKTISELKSAAEKVKEIGVQPFSSGLKEQWVCYDMFWFTQSPFLDMAKWYDDMNAGTASFKNEHSEEMFSLLDYIYKNSGDKPLSDDFAELCHQLAGGDTAMAVQGDWAYEETQKIDPDANLGMVGLPVSENPEEATMLVDSEEILFVSEDSPNKEGAVAFLKWMLSKEGAEFLGNLTGTPSVSAAEAEIEMSPFAEETQKWVADGGKTAPFAWNYWAPGIQDVVGKNMQEYFSENMTADQMFEDLDAQWSKTVN